MNCSALSTLSLMPNELQASQQERLLTQNTKTIFIQCITFDIFHERISGHFLIIFNLNKCSSRYKLLSLLSSKNLFLVLISIT